VKKKLRESRIEEAVCKYARDKGFLVYKFTSPARSFVPDRIFFKILVSTFTIEFKATGKKPTPPQEREHARLRAAGVFVFVVDDIAFGKGVIDGMLM
jgi:hypothetical protein